jgi:small GTP-binding protein
MKGKVLKILITGSYGSGKTTLVKTLSQIEPLLTEKKISRKEDIVEKNKNTTTVAMDMGKIKINDDLYIHIFSIPGQERFDFMFDILSKGILGAIVLVDATSPISVESVEVAKKIYKKIKEKFDIPVVFGVTKLDREKAYNFEEIKFLLEDYEDCATVPLDPRNLESAKNALLKLLSLIETGE